MMRAGSRSRRPVGCREAVGLVTDYLDGALPAGRRRRMEAHLAGCAGCSVHLEQIRAMVEALGCLRGDGVTGGVLRRLRVAFSGPGPGPSRAVGGGR
ncbi:MULTISPECIES: zf-HC2 domain-containing protein [Streptosporangium]|nr:zf-HC2 domain-containing protein [Streptosporangium brasiliense]